MPSPVPGTKKKKQGLSPHGVCTQDKYYKRSQLSMGWQPYKNNDAQGSFVNGSKMYSWILGKMCFCFDGGIGQCDYYYRKYVPLNVVKSRFQLIWGEAEFRIPCEKVGKEGKNAFWVRARGSRCACGPKSSESHVGEWMHLESETLKRRGLKILCLAFVCTGSGAKRSGAGKQMQKQPGEKREQS